MPTRLSDGDIARLIAERKELPGDFRARLQLRSKRGHKERDLEITGDEGSEFRLILRQSAHNPLDFSVILAHRPQGSGEWFRLRRYNGRSHEHTNKIEGSGPFYEFHVHTATERYQDLGMKEDTFAEASAAFGDMESALGCLLMECGFALPRTGQGFLFAEGIS